MAGCILWLWGIPDELAGGIAPLSHPYKEHPATPSAPPQFTAAGNHWSTFPFLLGGEGEEQLVHWGAEGAVEPFVCHIGFAMFNHGPGAQGSAWISGTELFKCEKKKRTEASHEGRCFLRAVLLWAPASYRSSHLSDDKCELIR